LQAFKKKGKTWKPKADHNRRKAQKSGAGGTGQTGGRKGDWLRGGADTNSSSRSGQGKKTHKKSETFEGEEGGARKKRLRDQKRKGEKALKTGRHRFSSKTKRN